MPTADLLERARSAVTVGEECDVIRSALARAYEPGSNVLTAMANAVLRVSIGELPRPVLLGVVAALVPEGARYVLNSERGISYRSENGVRVTIHPLKMPPHMLLLIAMLEASQ